MFVIQEPTHIAIPVFHKELKRIVSIKNTRFNPEIHEFLEDRENLELKQVHNLHRNQKIVLDDDTLEAAGLSVTSESSEETEEVQVVEQKEASEAAENVPKKKKRGMPKGGWPKKDKK